MIYLYDIDDGFKILKKKKKIVNIFIITGIIILGIILFVTYLSDSYFIMVVDIFLSCLYLFSLYTYLFYFRKKLNEEYHFLAKIEQLEHDFVLGSINVINEDILTIKNFEVYCISINDRTLYIEMDKIPDVFYEENILKLDIVDNFIVGYEVYEK